MKADLKDGFGWRAALLPDLQKERLVGDVYQFGVAGGFSLQALATICQTLKQTPRFIGFDVFTGMPKETSEPDKQIDTPGQFKLNEIEGVPTVEEAMIRLQKDICSCLPNNSSLCLVKGLVEETLNQNLIKSLNLNPALYVDMDLDIYSPTKYVLDFMIRNKLIVPGTIIGFDDWNQNWTSEFVYGAAGESRAFKEISEEHRLNTLCLGNTKNYQQAAYVVLN